MSARMRGIALVFLLGFMVFMIPVTVTANTSTIIPLNDKMRPPTPNPGLIDKVREEILGPYPELGYVWAEKELEYWGGTWIREPGEDRFHATWINKDGQIVEDWVEIIDVDTGLNGKINHVTLQRLGTGATYSGDVDLNKRTITGDISSYSTTDYHSYEFEWNIAMFPPDVTPTLSKPHPSIYAVYDAGQGATWVRTDAKGGNDKYEGTWINSAGTSSSDTLVYSYLGNNKVTFFRDGKNLLYSGQQSGSLITGTYSENGYDFGWVAKRIDY